MNKNNKLITLYDGPVALIDGSPVLIAAEDFPGGGEHGGSSIPAPLDKGGMAPATSPPLPKGGCSQQDLRRQGGFTVGSQGGFIPGGGSEAGRGTIAYSIMESHNRGADGELFRLKFDALVSHDITYVGIVQTARASGMAGFPVPYALTNCHNSLCAVGGTINEDDHAFGLSAARKYGGIYVPANQAVIHQYARETLCAAGGMILGSDSHTRYGALGVMGVGEGGPELVKQLLNNTYDIKPPEVVLVWLENTPPHGVGPHDIATALCAAVYGNGFVKNKILEFAGPGIDVLPMDYRFGIDVMTTETACLSSIWRTDDQIVNDYYANHGRSDAYRPLAPENGAAYSSMIKIDLACAEPMIAMPFHPSNAFTISEANANAADILRGIEIEAIRQFGGNVALKLTDKAENGRIRMDQGIIAGCAGGMYDNIRESAAILDGASIGDGGFALSVYPSSMPINLRLVDDGIQSALIRAGALFKPCFCGPCFGAGDVPANNGLSIRHTTRNFINREGARPGDGQLAAVALADARSIAATAKYGGLLTSAAEIEYMSHDFDRGGQGGLDSLGDQGGHDGQGGLGKLGSQGGLDSQVGQGGLEIAGASPVFTGEIYKKRVYNGFGHPLPNEELKFGPNIADWPKIDPLGDHLLLRVASVIRDPVTTTDELIPSGETSSYRSNPIKLAGYTLSRRDPQYVGRAKETAGFELARKLGEAPAEAACALDTALRYIGADSHNTNAVSYRSKADVPSAGPGVQDLMCDVQIASVIFCMKPGDGSAREQAASCQRVLGGGANICYEYATKRYRSNLINWGILPFTIDMGAEFDAKPGDWIYAPGVREWIENGAEAFPAFCIKRVRDDGDGGGGSGSSSGGGDGSSGGSGGSGGGDAGNGHGAYCVSKLSLHVGALTAEEREIILHGCLMNYYAAKI